MLFFRRSVLMDKNDALYFLHFVNRIYFFKNFVCYSKTEAGNAGEQPEQG
jgi:hypothetical protein